MINKLYCAWCAIANTTLLNIEWPDGNSQYYGTLINNTNFTIEGYFPNTRYFSYQLYYLDTWEPFWDIYDKEIEAKENPYRDNINYTENIPYKIDSNINIEGSYFLIYRLYLGIDNYGGVPLPIIKINNEIISECDMGNRPVINIQDNTPDYVVFRANEDDNFYPPQTTDNLFINNDANYMISFYNNSKNDFKYAKIIVKAPSFPSNIKQIRDGNYNVRYFSFSTVDLSEPKQTIQTIYDSMLDSKDIEFFVSCTTNNRFIININPPAKNESYNCYSETGYFGILYRQLLPNFSEKIPNSGKTRIGVKMSMKDYYPNIYWN